ncbi:MAG: hypothetical protein HWN65_23920 [Candidatus Helarchaeota archaeon]|nr:hypothetical protein [Candidatus Helarchaeota archaeon]
MKSRNGSISEVLPALQIKKLSNSLLLINENFMLAVPNTLPFTTIGPFWIRWQNSWRYAGDSLEVKIPKKPLQFTSREVILDGSTVKRINFHSKQKITLKISLFKEKKYFLISLSSNKEHFNAQIILSINYDKSNAYDYVNLSGNLYRKTNIPLNLNLKVPYTGAFSQVWTLHSKNCFAGLMGAEEALNKAFSARTNKNYARISVEIKGSPNNPSNIYILLGPGEIFLPVKMRFSEIAPIKPLPFKYKDDLKREALKSFRALTKYFLLKTPHGAVPANFIFPPETEDGLFRKMNFGSFGNCFSLGFIYGTNALYQWTKQDSILKILTDKFLPPVLKGAQIQNGPTAGAFFETYNDVKKRWTTGRVQFPGGGFSDWFPFTKDRKGNAGNLVISLPKRELSIGGLPYLLSTGLFTLRQTIKTIPYVFKRIPKRVIFPAYSGQFAYFLLQTLQESLANGHFLGTPMEDELKRSLNLTSNFLQEYQREDGLWDHELFEDGTVFWEKRTLACIYPATFLYWWGSFTKEKDLQIRALKAINQCIRLLARGEFYGVYFETNLAINQDDLVTGLACIKCHSRLYKLTHDKKYLNNARIAAWHVLSYMWGNNIYDRLNNCITGGIPVTTYKSLGFPVIGGSELCQTIEALLELSRFDNTFFPHAVAALGYHSNYLYESNRYIGATHEIIWGIGENWSTSTSADFASYATGPFIRALYLYKNH